MPVPAPPTPTAAPPPSYGPAGWSPSAGGAPPPAIPTSERIRYAWQRRPETDYIFDYWTALGWTVLTIGFYGLYVFYQLVRRMRDHNARRLELLDASVTFAWEEAGRRGLQQELTPSFQRAAAHLDVLRQMTRDFRDPVIWLILGIVARGITDIIAFVLLDRDLSKHDQAEVGIEYELAVIFGRFGQSLPGPDQGRVKKPDNYVGRIVATVFTIGIYAFWWTYNQMDVPNRHFRVNWAQEDALAVAVQALQPASS